MTPLPYRLHALHAAVFLMLPIAALADNPNKEGYLLDARGGVVQRNLPSECWRTGEWTPAMAIAPCDPVANPVVVAAAPKAAAPAFAPAPVAVMPAPAPMKAPPQLMSFSAEALFAFDKSVITPDGKKALDDAGTALKSQQAQEIHVVGHADRLGSAAYNQKLSIRRADAVRDYLVSTGIATDRISSSGVGETQPVTKPEDCPGKQSAKVIACLQPDRRVDIDFQGSAP
jgi:OOP family OmpA-OmpF porin